MIRAARAAPAKESGTNAIAPDFSDFHLVVDNGPDGHPAEFRSRSALVSEVL